MPSRSDTVLVSSVTYDSAGLTYETTDPKGIVARTLYDDLGRTTKTIEHTVDSTVGDDNDKTTEYAYGPAGMTSLTAKLTGGGGQTTEWVYGVTSGVYSNDIVGETRWPDPSTGAASSSEDEHVTVNALGQTLTSEDRNGNLHTFGYDVVGRLTDDVLTTLGTNVDGAVRRISTAYDGQGNPYLLTSHDATTSGNIVNQVQRAYNGLGQLITEWQSHSGAVNTSTSPKVQYAYSEMPSGANHSRLTGMTYPNGRSLAYNYSSGLNSDISRLSSISDGGTTLESYDYLGLGTVVLRSHPQPGVNLTYIGSLADAGDQYAGLDRFGRIVDQNWDKSGTAVDRYQYAYDRNGNRTCRTNAVNSAFNEIYTYDSLNQIITFNRNSGTRTLDWDYDAIGNMESVTTNGGSPVTRTHNKQNELTVMGGNSLAFDPNGNMTTDETGKQFIYDGWNRVVEVKASGGATMIEYQYDARNYRVIEDDGTAKDLYYSSEWQLLEERVSGNAVASYVWSPIYIDAMIARDRDSDANGSLDERLYPTHDANFNITGLLNTSGSIVERLAYDPFGIATILSAGWSSLGSSVYSWAHQHQGLRLVATSNLLANRTRDLSAFQGRFTIRDVIGYSSGEIDLYRYEGNRPINRIDPIGTEEIEIAPGTHRAIWIATQSDWVTATAAAWHTVGTTFNSLVPGGLFGCGNIRTANRALGSVFPYYLNSHTVRIDKTESIVEAVQNMERRGLLSAESTIHQIVLSNHGTEMGRIIPHNALRKDEEIYLGILNEYYQRHGYDPAKPNPKGILPFDPVEMIKETRATLDTRLAEIEPYRDALDKVKRKLSDNALIRIKACNVGMRTDFMIDLANYMGASVAANTGSISGVALGDWKIAKPGLNRVVDEIQRSILPPSGAP